MKREVRTATESDLPALLALYAELTGDEQPCSHEQAASILYRLQLYPGSNLMVIERDHQIVSTVTLIVIPNLTRGGRPYALIENVVTATKFRGLGLATALLDHAVNAAWAHNCYKVMLLTGSNDPATLAFYEKAGFEQSKTGFQKRQLPQRQELSMNAGPKEY